MRPLGPGVRANDGRVDESVRVSVVVVVVAMVGLFV